ncbi:uncharacterized protein [Gossypium hirsutum]|uniref:Uncharacterized protein n=1 Tax=Gossypium hirsutum TaxID=3635 RepID=A0ABM3BBW9_GOSHI|nr:uncharacterized protein LOC107920461 [Gossypium hirsutum]
MSENDTPISGFIPLNSSDAAGKSAPTTRGSELMMFPLDAVKSRSTRKVLNSSLGNCLSKGSFVKLPKTLRVEFVIPTLGLHMAVNACAAAAIATSMGVLFLKLEDPYLDTFLLV